MSTESKTHGQKSLEKRLGKLTIGEFLHTWRTSEQMSLKEFGRLIGFSVAHLCDVEKGRKGVSPAKAEHVAKVIGVPAALLVRLSIEQSLREAGLRYRIDLKPAA